VRIAWVTAFTERSGIASFSRHVTAALAAHAEVEIWTNDELPLLESRLRVVRFDAAEQVEARLADFDIAVYNFGNTVRAHAEIHELSKRRPGIVILHDRVLHPMFVAKWRGAGGFMDPMYLSRMAAYYGDAGLRVATESLLGTRPPVWESDDVLTYPLSEEALLRALGAVVHSEGHARYIREHWFGPVRVLSLPVYSEVLASAPATTPRAAARLQLTTVGHINANKQCHRVLRMLADDDELSARVHYTIAGHLEPSNSYAADLGALLRSLPGVSAELLGWRDEDQLAQLMAATDIFVNLRHPIIEGASASLMHELAFGRPVLCFDDGAFGELPGDVVARVPAGDFDAVAAELGRLVSDPARRRALGERARTVAEGLTEAAYAESFMGFIGEVLGVAPGLRLIDSVADQLAAIRTDPRDPLFAELAEDLHGRLGAEVSTVMRGRGPRSQRPSGQPTGAPRA